jgi:hypothetical protein
MTYGKETIRDTFAQKTVKLYESTVKDITTNMEILLIFAVE